MSDELVAERIAERLVEYSDNCRRRHFSVIDEYKPVPFPIHWRRKILAGSSEDANMRKGDNMDSSLDRPCKPSDFPEARHWFDFSREPPCFHENGVMEAWCFICCRWESWRLYGDSKIR